MFPAHQCHFYFKDPGFIGTDSGSSIGLYIGSGSGIQLSTVINGWTGDKQKDRIRLSSNEAGSLNYSDAIGESENDASCESEVSWIFFIRDTYMHRHLR